MAILKMAALTMVGPHDEMEPVARQMVLSGGFQPLPLDYLVNDRSLRARITTESDNPYDDLLNRMTALWKIAGEPIPDPNPIALGEDFNLQEARHTVDQTTGKLGIWENRREILTEELEMLEAARIYIKALANLNMKPNELAAARFAIAHFGRMSRENFVRLNESTPDAPILGVELFDSGGAVWVLVFTIPSYEESAKKILNAVYFKGFSLKDIAEHFSKDDPLGQIEHSIELHKRSIKGLEDAALNILKNNRHEYEELFSRLYTMQRVYDLCKGRGEVCGMYILSGWIPEDTYETVKKTIERDAPLTTIVVEQVSDIPFTGIRVPTLLRNSKLVQAFQSIVAMYSVPSYGEVDPAPFVAFTFILFFGFMFGDVGHAILLFTAATYFGKKGILNKPLAYVMKCASCSAFVFGLLYGSVMGIEGFFFKPIWLSPMHNTGLLFSIAIITGVVMISTGMILNMISRYRERDFGRLLFDGQGLAGLLVYWGAAGAICISIFDLTLPFSVSYLWYAIAALVVLTLFRDTLARMLLHQKVEEESATLKVFEVLHNLMNYFTNTASFVRLAAFALNHVALSMAVLILAGMLERLPGGLILKALLFVAGNIFIVCLEGLIVFIQVLRLEYYEFFSKFYRGGGNVFKPVTWKNEKAFRRVPEVLK
ncbi:MAG: ATPase [Synergistaceae bacterium]|jgi:V/A-type H+-transporting ATPase subunit I|nr:ATPase [Synergistaceae bacterium]